jgi:hypothetical protein
MVLCVFAVDIYDTYDEFAAFRIDRRYYRGGSNNDVKKALGLPKRADGNGGTADEIRKQ